MVEELHEERNREEAMTVHIVVGYATGHGPVLIGVFSTKELADACAAEVLGRSVHSCVLDEKLDPRPLA